MAFKAKSFKAIEIDPNKTYLFIATYDFRNHVSVEEMESIFNIVEKTVKEISKRNYLLLIPENLELDTVGRINQLDTVGRINHSQLINKLQELIDELKEIKVQEVLER